MYEKYNDNAEIAKLFFCDIMLIECFALKPE